jgi:hypothetical protein
VSSKSRTGLAVAGVVLLAAGGIYWRLSRSLPAADLLKRLPSANAMVLYVDFDALRRAGVLQLFDGSKTGEDPEYKSFVAATGFNYTRDLDTAAVAFAPSGKYLLLRGRFEWPKLDAYVKNQQGQCANSVCRMTGSTPERRISFFPLRSGVMAMAVSTDDFAVQRLATPGSGPDPEVPHAPLWLSIPPSVLKSGESLPEGTRMFAHSMDRADSVSLELAPEGNRLAMRLNVLCRTGEDAAQVASELARITALLRELIQREHQTPNSGDLSGVLTSGSFKAEGKRVSGYWPIERKFVENMLTGGA